MESKHDLGTDPKTGTVWLLGPEELPQPVPAAAVTLTNSHGLIYLSTEQAKALTRHLVRLFPDAAKPEPRPLEAGDWCPRCKGEGWLENHDNTRKCLACEGTGKVQKPKEQSEADKAYMAELAEKLIERSEEIENDPDPEPKPEEPAAGPTGGPAGPDNGKASKSAHWGPSTKPPPFTPYSGHLYFRGKARQG